MEPHGTDQRATAATLPVLGWKEEASLPDWGIEGLRVKLDTGARTSALHVLRFTVVGHHHHHGEPLPVARLTVPLSRVDPDRIVTVTTPVVAYKSVRDTRARSELRPVVRTRIRCGPLDEEIDITVTDRAGMIFRMILGRQALAGRVLVDPSVGYTTRGSRAARGRKEARR
jgi:hypothetical protein